MKKIIVTAVFFCLLSAVPAFAQMPCPNCSGHDDGMSDHGSMGMGMMGILQFKKDLNLTAEQEQSIQNIRIAAAKDAIRRQADIKAARLDMMNAMRQDNPDFAAQRKFAKQISDLQLQQKLAMIDAMEKSYGVLTKDQKAKLPQMMMQRGGMMRGMHDGDQDED